MNVKIKQPREMARPEFDHRQDLWLHRAECPHRVALSVAQRRAAGRGCRQVVRMLGRGWIVQDVR